MTSASPGSDPWPLLRNSASSSSVRALRLAVHGRSGGAVPDCLHSLVKDLQLQRLAPVQLEVLTALAPPDHPPEPSWLIPLLLWPGAHARIDVPAIRNRLRQQGSSVTMLPFLGAWPRWWTAVAQALPRVEAERFVLVHHPLRPGVADRFLIGLSRRLGMPMLSFDQWPAHQALHPGDCPLPLALAPNRMTESLSEAGGLPPLLEEPLIRQVLIDLLAALP
ncbi:MAG: DNA mismatch repair protein MutS [Cyanobacteriota bacterium]|nr:DNA mismatch repair protein MutS [Cyanobacteriota bacterium]